MRYLISIVFFSLFTFSTLFSQGLTFEDDKEAMSFYGDVMINALDEANRIKAAEAFQTLFERRLSVENSFDTSLEDLKFISVQYPEDRSFRMLSWEIKESDSSFKYTTYVQTAESKVHKFTNNAYLSDNDLETTFTRNWPAHLVYKIKDTDTENGKSYIVFGMKQIDQYNKVKIADVLQITDDGISFGAPLFVKNAESERPRKSNRVILDYAVDGNASLNYNPSLELIVHDNVIPQAGMMPGQGVSNYPDGSYQAYKLEAGKWNHIEKLYNTIMSEAPRPKPLDKKSKSIFGDKKN